MEMTVLKFFLCKMQIIFQPACKRLVLLTVGRFAITQERLLFHDVHWNFNTWNFSEYGQSDCERNLQQFYFMQISQDGLNLSHYHLCCTKKNSLRFNHFSSAGFSSSAASSHQTYFPFFQVKGIKSVKTRTTQTELTL